MRCTLTILAGAALGLPALTHAGDLDPTAAPAPTMVTLEEIAAGVASAEAAASTAATLAANAEMSASAAATNALNAESAAQAARQAAEDALEGRIPFLPNASDAPGILIDQPGHYVLTGNVTMSDPNATCIQVSAEDVTIDLNGHTIGSSLAGMGQGIGQTSGARMRVFNGTVRDFGGAGIVPSGEAWIHDVWIDSCNQGIVANSAPRGLYERCRVSGSLNTAISLISSGGSVVRGCLVVSNSSGGMNLVSSNDCTVSGNIFNGNGAGGLTIFGPTSGCIVEGNEFINHTLSTGLNAGGSGHIVVGNIARGNFTDYNGVDANTIHDLSVETTPPPGYANVQP